MQADKRELNLAILGDAGVGKSSLAIRFIHKLWVEAYDPTIEDFYRKSITIDEKPYYLGILDTAGADWFDAMYDSYIRQSQGFLLLFAVDNEQSVETVVTVVARARTRSPLMPFIETSAKVDHNVTEVFETLARLMIDMNVALTSGKRKHRKDNHRCVLS
ncbi:rap2c, member of RAS oncoprotein [Balamuthia mandrillaris]